MIFRCTDKTDRTVEMECRNGLQFPKVSIVCYIKMAAMCLLEKLHVDSR